MPGGKTKFSKEWLNLKDCNGCNLSEWCQASKVSSFKAFCRLCNKNISCDNQGSQQVLQHASGSMHTKLSKDILKGNQQVILVAEERKHDKAPLQCVSHKDSATKAELIWAMKVVASKYSYSSCDDIKSVFSEMFPNANLDNFTMSSAKVSYLISEATGPYFTSLMAEDVNTSASFFTLEYDETTNKQVKKQLDILLRYWSNKFERVISHHLKTFLLGHATAAILSDKLVAAIQENGLSLGKLLMLGSDGPNVNESVWLKINELVKGERKEGLVDIGSCKLHVVHNAFGKGMLMYGKNVGDFLIDIYTWFKLSAARREDFALVQAKLGVQQHMFLKHVECRWLSLLPAISRILEQWGAVREYFLVFLPKQQPTVCTQNARYTRISNQLQKKETFFQLHFLKYTGGLFNNFLTLFQRDEPLIHILYDRLIDICILLLSRFVKKEVIEAKSKTNLGQVDLKLSVNQLKDKAVDIGEETRKALNDIPQEKHAMIMRSVRSFYETVSGKLIEKLPLSTSILRDCRCLNPSSRSETWSLEACKGMARKLPIGLDVDVVGDEWRLYQLENIPEEWLTEKTGETVKHKRVDFYWSNIFKIKTLEELKYPNLKRLVQAALVLAHGNADVERGFSESGKSVTSERTSLSEVSINSIRSTSDGLKAFGNRPHLVPITKKFLSLGYSAHAHYIQRLEKQKKKIEQEKKEQLEKEAEEKKKACLMQDMLKSKEKIAEKEKKLSILENNNNEEMKLGAALVKEANKKLKKALEEKNLQGVAIAQAMLEAGQKKIEHGQEELQETRTEQKKVEKRKQAMITNFLEPSVKKKKTR